MAKQLKVQQNPLESFEFQLFFVVVFVLQDETDGFNIFVRVHVFYYVSPLFLFYCCGLDFANHFSDNIVRFHVMLCLEVNSKEVGNRGNDLLLDEPGVAPSVTMKLH